MQKERSTWKLEIQSKHPFPRAGRGWVGKWTYDPNIFITIELPRVACKHTACSLQYTEKKLSNTVTLKMRHLENTLHQDYLKEFRFISNNSFYSLIHSEGSCTHSFFLLLFWFLKSVTRLYDCKMGKREMHGYSHFLICLYFPFLTPCNVLVWNVGSWWVCIFSALLSQIDMKVVLTKDEGTQLSGGGTRNALLKGTGRFFWAVMSIMTD